VLRRLKGDHPPIHAASISDRYTIFETTYQSLIMHYVQSAMVREDKTPYAFLMDELHRLVRATGANARAASSHQAKKIPGLEWTHVVQGTALLTTALAVSVPEKDFREQVLAFIKANKDLCTGILAPATPAAVHSALEAGREDACSVPSLLTLLSHCVKRTIVLLDWQGAVISLVGAEFPCADDTLPVFLSKHPSDAFDYYAYQYQYMSFRRVVRDPAKLVQDLKKGTFEARSRKTVDWLNDQVYSNLPSILAHIFALWSILNAPDRGHGEARGAGATSKPDQPHPTQVFAVFRLLGMGDAQEMMQNSIVELGTGEGKSLVLAVVSAVLALLGAEVHCACYSKHLSARDFKAFENLFIALSVRRYIHYGTFEELSESIINRNAKVRDRVERIILGAPAMDAPGAAPAAGAASAASASASSSGAPSASASAPSDVPLEGRGIKVLVIDEIDVFFNPSLFGELYSPVATVRTPTISALCKAVWDAEGPSSTLAPAARAQMVQIAADACTAELGGFGFLVKSALQKMLADVKQFNEPRYIVKHDKIGYVSKGKDHPSFNKTHGYKTLFAYFQEHARGLISADALRDFLALEVKCGFFSYAELPHTFSFILGASGTLKALQESGHPACGLARENYR
jgi:hypothetical protein